MYVHLLYVYVRFVELFIFTLSMVTIFFTYDSQNTLLYRGKSYF